MKIHVDKSMKELGITDVVIGIVKNLNPHAELTEKFKQKMYEREQWALNTDLNEIKKNPVIEGYKDIITKVSRSVKKNPPTVSGFINNIKHRGNIPHVNSIVDIYNAESLNSLLAIGAHDFDKISFPIIFTVCRKEDTFYPISSNSKHVAETDFVYRDNKGIMAWLDVRDSELYKLDENTKNVLFVIQGNANTSVDMRIEALERIRDDLKGCMPESEFEIKVIHVEE